MTTAVAAPPGSGPAIRRSRALRAVAAAALVAAAVVLANASPRLPGLHADGVQYLEEAKSLARGDAPRVPVGSWDATEPTSGMTFHPPGFPLAIAALIAAGVRADIAAVLVMAMSAAATVLLVFSLAADLSGAGAGALAAALVLFAPDWARLHTAVWSEPLYLVCFLAAVRSMVGRPDRSAEHGALALAATVVRHVGVAVAATAAALALLRPGPGRARIGRAAVAALPSALFFAAWNVFGADDAAPVRRVAAQAGAVGWIGDAPRAFARWLVPVGHGAAHAAAAVAAGVALTALLLRSPLWRAGAPRRFARIALGVSALHVAVVALSRLLLDPAIPLDFRLLVPLPLLLAIATGAAAADRWRSARPPHRVHVALAAALAGWIAAGASQIGAGVRAIQEYGQYYTASVWDGAAVIRWAAELGEAGGPPPYSNEPELLYLRTGRPAYRLPRSGVALEDFARAFRARPAPILVVEPVRPNDFTAERLMAHLPVRLLMRSAEGVVLVPKDER